MFAALFWFSLVLVFYGYVGFPVLVFLAGKLLRRRVKKCYMTPPVSVIIAAYNEEEHIRRRLRNAVEVDYPEDLLEIIVASDGSTDRTEEIVKSFRGRVRLLALPRRGKIHALKEAINRASGEILVLSDANIFFARQTIRELCANFADPEVGCVAGNKQYRVIGKESIGLGENMYWSYDKWLKVQETLTGSTVSADGALYAIRQSLCRIPEASDVTDDFAISTAVVEQGYRLVFDPAAIAYEDTVEKAKREFSRKIRLMTRGLRGVLLRCRLLNPFHFGFYSIQLFSHKVLRRLIGFLLLIMLVTSLAASYESPFFRLASIGQLLFYLVALLGYALRSNRFGRSKLLVMPFFFCLGNVAASLAVLNILRGKRIKLWEPQRHNPLH